MLTVTIEEAKAGLDGLIEGLQPGESLIITRDDKPIARLVPEPVRDMTPRRSGTMKGTILYMAPDFDAPLDDFKEYME